MNPETNGQYSAQSGQQAGTYYGGGAYPSPSYGAQAGAGNSFGKSLVYNVLIGLNLLYVFLTAGYSIGLFSEDGLITDSGTFIVILVMTIIAGAFGIFMSLHQKRNALFSGKQLSSKVYQLTTLAFFILGALIFIGPLFN